MFFKNFLNFSKYFSTAKTQEIIAKRNQLIRYINNLDTESVKLHLEKYPDLLRLCAIYDDKMTDLYGSFLNYTFEKLNSDLRKDHKTLTTREKIQKYDNIILYFIRHEDTDLLAECEANPFMLVGEDFFGYLNYNFGRYQNRHIDIYFRTKKFISAMLEREEFKITSNDSQNHKFLQNQRYIQLSSSQKIFNINYQNKHGQTFAYYLFPYCGFDEVLSFLQRKDVDLSLSNCKDLLSNFLFFFQENIILTGKECLPYLITMIDLLKKKNIEFYLNDKYFDLIHNVLAIMCRDNENFYRNQETRKSFLYIISYFLRNSKNELTPEIAKEFLDSGFCALIKKKLNKKDFIYLINSTDCEGDTLLHLLVQQGMLRRARCLIQHGARVDILNNDGYTALHLAALKGNLKEYRNFLAKNEDYTSLFVKENDFGETPENINQYILDNANKKIVRNYEVISLQTARFLMKICKDCFKNHENELNNTSNIWRLYLSTMFNGYTKIAFDLSISALILKSILNVTDLKGNTMLHILLMHELNRYVDSLELETPETKKHHERFASIIEDFVKYGFDATKQNENGDTAMHLAAATGSMTLLAAFAVLEKNGSTTGNTKNNKIFYIENHKGKAPLEIIASVTSEILGMHDDQQKTNIPTRPEDITSNKFRYTENSIIPSFKMFL